MGRDYSHRTEKGVRGGGGGRSGGGDPTVVTGCMSSLFRFFDFHHFQLCYHLNQNHQHGNAANHFDFNSSTSQSLKGLEAPRNSLESEDGLCSESAPSIAKPVSELLTIPQMSVKTKRRPIKGLSSEELSEDGFSSPGSRTPSLVARLMGLDLLPEASSPSVSSIMLPQTQPARKQMKNSGTQSLPESPRISLARWSDVDLHHRLSLQVNSKRVDTLCKRRDMIKSLVQNSEAEGWSPGHYAKQIVKQVKQSVGSSKRVGLAEITNTVKSRAATEHRRDEHLLPGVKLKPPSSPSSATLSSKKSAQKTTISFRSQDVENQPPTTSSNTQKQVLSLSSSTATPTKVKSFSSKPIMSNEKTRPKLKCRKAVEDKFKFKFTKSSAATTSSKNKKEREPLFIRPTSPTSTPNQHRNKSPLTPKITPLSTTDKQFNITSTTATRTSLHPIKQVVTSTDNQKGQHQKQQLQLEKQNYSSEANTQTLGVHEIQYMSKILKCMGIVNNTRVSNISNWFSQSHPLNPSIFNLLEPISSFNNSILKCNRRLIFQLTDQILADILRPSMCTGYVTIMNMNGGDLVKLLTSKMGSFPMSECRVLDDVDALVGSDFDRVGLESALEDEKRSVVRELEREILDCLLLETTSLL